MRRSAGADARPTSLRARACLTLCLCAVGELGEQRTQRVGCVLGRASRCAYVPWASWASNPGLSDAIQALAGVSTV